MKSILLKTILHLSLLSSFLIHPLVISDDRSLYGDSKLLSEIFINRHSGKNFEIEPISEEQIKALVQSARWSPSCYNDQPWNFIFCDRFTSPEAYVKVLDSIYGQDWIENVPLFVIAVVRSDFTYNGKFNEWAEYDTGAAALAMSLQAVDMGLMAHQIGGFDGDLVQQAFQIPEGFYPLTIIAIGHEEQTTSLDENQRKRRPEQENFFSGEWGQSFRQASVQN